VLTASPSHGENRGSSPLGSANKVKHLWFWNYGGVHPSSIPSLTCRQGGPRERSAAEAAPAFCDARHLRYPGGKDASAASLSLPTAVDDREAGSPCFARGTPSAHSGMRAKPARRPAGKALFQMRGVFTVAEWRLLRGGKRPKPPPKVSRPREPHHFASCVASVPHL
jgi:hypothetical protein